MLAECSDELIRCLIPIERQYPRITRIVLKHPVLTVLFQQERLHGNGRQKWHDGTEFLWDGLGVRDVRHNEARHACQQGNGFRDVPIGWLVEIKKDWKIVVPTQFLADSVED